MIPAIDLIEFIDSSLSSHGMCETGANHCGSGRERGDPVRAFGGGFVIPPEVDDCIPNKNGQSPRILAGLIQKHQANDFVPGNRNFNDPVTVNTQARDFFFRQIYLLSLRNVAKRIGVSHAAPYNHFHDKQALLAAISTAGHEQLHQTLLRTFEKSKDTSTAIILEIAWVYLQFAMEDPDRFKLMFSGVLEEQRNHPAYMEIAQKSISLFEEIIAFCQGKGQLAEGDVQRIAIKLWSTRHGFTTLILEDRFPHEYLQDQNLKELLKTVIS